MSELLAALIYHEVFLPDITAVLTSVTEPLGNIVLWTSDSCFFTQHISAIMNIFVNFRGSNFTSKAVSNLPLQENRTMVHLTTSKT